MYRAPFPLYTIKVDPTTGLVITGGGGGASKTGIKNALVSFGLKKRKESKKDVISLQTEF